MISRVWPALLLVLVFWQPLEGQWQKENLLGLDASLVGANNSFPVEHLFSSLEKPTLLALYQLARSAPDDRDLAVWVQGQSLLRSFVPTKLGSWSVGLGAEGYGQLGVSRKLLEFMDKGSSSDTLRVSFDEANRFRVVTYAHASIAWLSPEFKLADHISLRAGGGLHYLQLFHGYEFKSMNSEFVFYERIIQRPEFVEQVITRGNGRGWTVQGEGSVQTAALRFRYTEKHLVLPEGRMSLPGSLQMDFVWPYSQASSLQMFSSKGLGQDRVFLGADLKLGSHFLPMAGILLCHDSELGSGMAAAFRSRLSIFSLGARGEFCGKSAFAALLIGLL